jgi:hypothetical protein
VRFHHWTQTHDAILNGELELVQAFVSTRPTDQAAVFSAKRYLREATRVAAMADTASGADIRKELLRTAGEYIRLAARAAATAR